MSYHDPLWLRRAREGVYLASVRSATATVNELNMEDPRVSPNVGSTKTSRTGGWPTGHHIPLVLRRRWVRTQSEMKMARVELFPKEFRPHTRRSQERLRLSVGLLTLVGEHCLLTLPGRLDRNPLFVRFIDAMRWRLTSGGVKGLLQWIKHHRVVFRR